MGEGFPPCSNRVFHVHMEDFLTCVLYHHIIYHTIIVIIDHQQRVIIVMRFTPIASDNSLQEKASGSHQDNDNGPPPTPLTLTHLTPGDRKACCNINTSLLQSVTKID
jgi:hypothetical protein